MADEKESNEKASPDAEAQKPEEKELDKLIKSIEEKFDQEEDKREVNLLTTYLKDRLVGQQKWYEGKATQNKKEFMRFQKIVIILSAFIPIQVILCKALGEIDFFGLFSFNFDTHSALISACVSAVLAVLAGLDKLKNPQTVWYNYRANEENLKKEFYMCIHEVGPYETDNLTELRKTLVSRVESIISADMSRFVDQQKAKTQGGNTQQNTAQNTASAPATPPPTAENAASPPANITPLIPATDSTPTTPEENPPKNENPDNPPNSGS